MPKPGLVIPCYNEADRLNLDEIIAWARDTGVYVLFVDDASTDSTRSMLEAAVKDAPYQAAVTSLARQSGKGEAVRQGMSTLCASEFDPVGFADADLSTPLSEMATMLQLLESSGSIAIFGSRIKLLGKKIRRRKLRHYPGRLFATVASIVLGLPVYDTQCGAKWFRNTPLLVDALSQPFLSRWVFDVELIGRFLVPLSSSVDGVQAENLLEHPLSSWQDDGTTKLTPLAIAKVPFELATIYRALSARRAQRTPANARLA